MPYPCHYFRNVKPIEALGDPPSDLLSVSSSVNYNPIEFRSISGDDAIEFLNDPSRTPEQFEQFLANILSSASTDPEYNRTLEDRLSICATPTVLMSPHILSIADKRLLLTSSLLKLTSKLESSDEQFSLTERIALAIKINSLRTSPENSSNPILKDHMNNVVTSLSALTPSTFGESISKIMNHAQEVASAMSWVMRIPARLDEEYGQIFDISLSEFFKHIPKFYDFHLHVLLEEPIYSSYAQALLTRETQKIMGDQSRWESPILANLSAFEDYPWAYKWALNYATSYLSYLVDAYCLTNSSRLSEPLETDRFFKIILAERTHYLSFLEFVLNTGTCNSDVVQCGDEIEECAIQLSKINANSTSDIIFGALWDIEATACESWYEFDSFLIKSLDEKFNEGLSRKELENEINTLSSRLSHHLVNKNYDSYWSLLLSSFNLLCSLREERPDKKSRLTHQISRILENFYWAIATNPDLAIDLKENFYNSSLSRQFDEDSPKEEQTKSSIKRIFEVTPNYSKILSDKESDIFYTQVLYESFSKVLDRRHDHTSISRKDREILYHGLEISYSESCSPNKSKCIVDALAKLAICRGDIEPTLLERIKSINSEVCNLVKESDEGFYKNHFCPNLFEKFMEAQIPLPV